MNSKPAITEDDIMQLPEEPDRDDLDWSSICVATPVLFTRLLKERTGWGHFMAVQRMRPPRTGIQLLYVSRSDADRISFVQNIDYVEGHVLANSEEAHFRRITELNDERARRINENGGTEAVRPHTIVIPPLAFHDLPNEPKKARRKRLLAFQANLRASTADRIQAIVLALAGLSPDMLFFGLRGIDSKGYQLSFSTSEPKKAILGQLQASCQGFGITLHSLGMDDEERERTKKVEAKIEERGYLERAETAKTTEDVSALLQDLHLDNDEFETIVEDLTAQTVDEKAAKAIVDGLREMRLQAGASAPRAKATAVEEVEVEDKDPRE